MNAFNPLLDVQVDALIAQGQGNLAVRLVAAGPASLPAFAAGAHVDLHLPGGLIRQYSIASAPQTTDHYLLCIRRENPSRGGSDWLHDHIRVGDRMQISPPRNLFALQPARHSILLAGGIGITPLLSMAQALEAEGRSFELHYYVHQRQQAAFARQLQRGFQHGRVQLHCSSEGDSPRQQLPDSLNQPDPDTRIYSCGPWGFMTHIREQALQQGWDAAQVHQEAFAATPVVLETAPTGEAEFEVELAATGAVFGIPAGVSIARALGDAGVAVPLSCEMGICGACLTRVVSGEVDHRDTVQSEAEKATQPQQIALCCSRSRSARLVLDLG